MVFRFIIREHAAKASLIAVLRSMAIVTVLNLALIAVFISGPEVGFFCNDKSIRLPYRQDTVTFGTLVNIIVTVTVILAVLGEGLLATKHDNCLRKLLRMLFIFLAIVSSLTTVNTITSISKNNYGRLRPNFLDACQPANMTDLCRDPMVYITNYTCTGPFAQITAGDNSQSFPSGHSSVAVAWAVLIVGYIQYRATSGFLIVPRSILQLAIMTFAFYICLSRIKDHKHRDTDVIGGAAIGGGFALFVLVNVFRHFRILEYFDFVQEEKGNIRDSHETATHKENDENQKLTPSDD